MEPDEIKVGIDLANGESATISYTYDEDGTVTARSIHTGTFLARGPAAAILPTTGITGTFKTSKTWHIPIPAFPRWGWPYGTVVRSEVTGQTYMVIGRSIDPMYDLDVLDLAEGIYDKIDYDDHEVVE